jgi:hypothetical protein
VLLPTLNRAAVAAAVEVAANAIIALMVYSDSARVLLRFGTATSTIRNGQTGLERSVPMPDDASSSNSLRFLWL